MTARELVIHHLPREHNGARSPIAQEFSYWAGPGGHCLTRWAGGI